MTSRRILLCVAGAMTFATVAAAQPAQRDHRHPLDRQMNPNAPHPVPPSAMPTEAPPAPQEEHPGTKAGFEWIAGRWEWRAGKWAWVPGHWERQRAGKHWRAGQWEHRGNSWSWVDGEWVAGDATPPTPPPPPAGTPGGVTVTTPPTGAPPPPPTGEVRDHRKQWKIERPVVSSYWPTKGKVGAKIVIRGENFPTDAMVMWGGAQITGAKVTPNQIMFKVPPGATSGEISLHRDHGRDLPVGAFEIVATGDPEAEAKKAEEDRRKAAEAAWAAQQKALAKDRAARLAAWEQQEAQRESTRDQRREARLAEIRAKWEAAFLGDPDTQAELTLHAQRLAQLDRAKQLAELDANGKLAVRIDVALGKENDRHDQRMSALQSAFRTKGGAP